MGLKAHQPAMKPKYGRAEKPAALDTHSEPGVSETVLTTDSDLSPGRDREEG